MECILCGGPVEGWYQWRWEGIADGPVCQDCWREDISFPGHNPADGGVDDPEEAEPAFQIMRMRMIQNRRNG